MWQRIAFLLVAGASAALIGSQALRIALASMLGESVKPSDVKKAIALDPSNPELHRQLGLIYLYSLEDHDTPQGLTSIRRTTELNPNKPVYWLDLGSACDLVGDTACADQAFERGLSLNPMTPRVHWIVGNHYLLTHRTDLALARFRSVLDLSPDYATQIFALCLRALNQPEPILEKVLPPPAKDPKLSMAFIDFLSANGNPDFAYQAWKRTVANISQLPFPLVKPYLDRMLELRRYQDVASIWQDLQRMGAVRKVGSRDSTNLLYNGDFEQTPLNSGLDWHLESAHYLSADFSDPSAHDGTRCLRLDFTVSRNEEYEPVYQIVPVDPNRTYVLSALVRSDSITSDSGPRLRVMDATCSDCLDVSTQSTVGTSPWHAVSLRFRTRAETHFCRISVWRPRGRSFPTEISGQFWVDTTSLRAVTSEVGESEQRPDS